MGSRSKASNALPVLALLLPLLSLNIHTSISADTITQGQSLSGNQTIVSKEGKFELGFFTPGNSRNYYIGIWYKTIPEQTVVWVANRETPISNTSSSELKISEDGNLVLLNHYKILIWSSNSTSSTSTHNVASLLDTGNLVLRDGLNSSDLIWQSFDHPTDTRLPGGWLGMNNITGEYQMLTSWRNSEDPAPGYFSHRIDPDGSNQYVTLWNGSEEYWTSGVWNGQFFNLTPEMGSHHFLNISFIENDQGKYFSDNLYNNSTITRSVMERSGKLVQWFWLDDTKGWILFWSRPIAQCDVYSFCGAFGICDNSISYCSCLHGFEPVSVRDWDLNDWSSGCARKTHLQCSTNSSTNEEKDGFLMMPNMQLPGNSQILIARSREECELACLENCSCTAYAYKGECSIWTGDLRNLQQLSNDDSKARMFYLRLAASDLPNSSSKEKNAKIIAGAVAGVVCSLCIVLGLILTCRKLRSTQTANPLGGSLVPFTYADLRNVTNNFSEKLGKGGFGSVFKGSFPDSTVVAVKKLEGLTQGEKQFRTEVSILGAIQHINLVRLRGFCSERTKRLLVYDYMPNGSLDSYLSRNNSKFLDWRTKYQIVLGIARGLAYLHGNCREQIIHCDIKPENILLDAEFCPKVADFGMAKLVGRDFSRVLTTMKGTIGYLAPEWISGLAITPKVDVYSYGMMLLEVIAGRRNQEQPADGKFGFFPIWAAIEVNKGEILSLLDERLEGTADMVELSRACRVACWCIQDCENHRPSMGLIVQILEGLLEVTVPPIPRSLQYLIEDQDTPVSTYELSFA